MSLPLEEFDPIFSPLAGGVIVHFVQNPDVCGEKNRGFRGYQGGKIHFVRNGAGRLWAFGFGKIGLWAEGGNGKDGG